LDAGWALSWQYCERPDPPRDYEHQGKRIQHDKKETEPEIDLSGAYAGHPMPNADGEEHGRDEH
jgi:hypothetical protein